MRIYGELIGKLTATSENGLALLDRTLEVYITKRKVKFYLFASNIKGWHKETKIIKKMEVTFEHLHFLETIINEGVKYMEQTYNLTFSGCIKYNNLCINYNNKAS
jgi:hypothetical protein